jgi:hypothetical protein
MTLRSLSIDIQRECIMKRIVFCLWSLVAVHAIYADYGTFLRPRSITFDQTFELALTNYDRYHRQSDQIVSLYASPLYQRSTHESALAKFFLPNDKQCIAVREDGLGDVGSLWIDLISSDDTSFSSTVCLQPQRSSVGAYFLMHFYGDCLTSGLWASMSFAAINVKNNLHLCEDAVINPGTMSNLQTVTQALNNSEWLFGKWSACSLSKSGVDDIQIKLGYNYVFCDDALLGLYIIGGIPTGTKPHARYVFEPLIGSNHGSFGLGVKADYGFVFCDDHVIELMLDCKYRFIFSAQEYRSFDLCKQGKWSRYLQLVDAQAPLLSFPAINYLTKPVQVTPKSTVDLWLSMHYAYGDYNIEVGYDFWYRQKEQIRARCECPFFNDVQIGIFDMNGTLCGATPTSGSSTNITQSIVGPNSVVSDSSFVALTQADVNIASGASPKALTSKVYGSFAYTPEVCEIPLLAGVSGSYEFSHHNKLFNQWAIWVTLGISF